MRRKIRITRRKKERNNRMKEIAEALFNMAQGDYSVRLQTSSRQDELDAITSAVYMLSEEMSSLTNRLKAEKKYVEDVVQSLADSFILADLSGKVEVVNKATCELTGYSDEELIGRPISMLFSGEVSVFCEESLKKLVDDGTAMNFETSYLDKKGEKSPALITISIMRDTERQASGILILGRDMTKQKEDEEKLVLYKIMAESAQDAIFFKDLDSRYIIANAKVLEIMEATRKDVIGKNDYELMVDREEARRNVEDDKYVFRTGEVKEVTKQMTAPDGQEYWFQAIRVPVFDSDGNVRGLVGVARDITERKRLADNLATSEKRFRSMVENAGDIIVICNLERKIEFISPSVQRISGFKPDELLGKDFRDFVHPEEVEDALKSMDGAASSPKESQALDVRFLGKNGEWLYGEAVGQAIIDESGELKIIANVRDITERKKAEEEIARLSRRVAEEYEEARRKIAIDLHDEIGQSLNALKIELGIIKGGGGGGTQ
jgi:PAS domain S-box-containing protein